MRPLLVGIGLTGSFHYFPHPLATTTAYLSYVAFGTWAGLHLLEKHFVLENLNRELCVVDGRDVVDPKQAHVAFKDFEKRGLMSGGLDVIVIGEAVTQWFCGQLSIGKLAIFESHHEKREARDFTLHSLPHPSYFARNVDERRTVVERSMRAMRGRLRSLGNVQDDLASEIEGFIYPQSLKEIYNSYPEEVRRCWGGRYRWPLKWRDDGFAAKGPRPLWKAVIRRTSRQSIVVGAGELCCLTKVERRLDVGHPIQTSWPSFKEGQ